jgi:hypothetical protein
VSGAAITRRSARLGAACLLNVAAAAAVLYARNIITAGSARSIPKL